MNDNNCRFPGLHCEGDATILIEGTNNLKGFYEEYPGLHVPQGKTLTLNGSGSLNASSNGSGAGIGGGLYLSCGNIIIDGGTINAYGGKYCPGIGCGVLAQRDEIFINDGHITAVKGEASDVSVGSAYDGIYKDGTIKVCGLYYKADEDIFTYGLGGSNTKGTFSVKINATSNYSINSMALYGRACLGLNEDGSYKLGDWKKLVEYSSGFFGNVFNPKLTMYDDEPFDILRNYVELGFEFDITGGTSWPYSGVFWTADKTRNQKIDEVVINLSGTSLNAYISIMMNKKEYSEIKGSDCYSHTQYDWTRNDDNIKVIIRKPGVYLTNCRNFYARKSGGNWELKYKQEDENNTFSLTPDYVEFGFEFYQTGGTAWPYSDVFWTESESNIRKPHTIEIIMGGTLFSAEIEISIDGTRKFLDGFCKSHNQYQW